MAKLNATNPLTGSKMDLSIKGIIAMLIGGLAIWFVAATSQNIGRAINAKVNNKYLDFEPDAINRQEVKVDPMSAVVDYGR